MMDELCMPNLLSTNAPHPAAHSIWVKALPPGVRRRSISACDLPAGHRLIGASGRARVLQITGAPVRGLRGASSCAERAGGAVRVLAGVVWASFFLDRDACRSKGGA
jgi:hypothetical protein